MLITGAFILHQTKDDSKNTKARLVSRYPQLSCIPAGFLHRYVRPNLPISKLGMGHIAIRTKEIPGRRESVDVRLNFRGIPDLPREMIQNERRSLQKIRKAIRCEMDNRIDGVGLGAYTSIIGDGGGIIAREFSSSVFVTTGNAYTAGTGVLAALDLGRKVGNDLSVSTITIIGAAGGIGRIAAKLAARKVGRVLLVGTTIDQRLLDLAEEINKSGGNAQATTTEDALPQSDIVISATSADNELEIDPSLFKTGAVIVDLARPRDIGRKVAAAREDVLIIDGGIIACPQVLEQTWDFGFPDGTVFACMAETMILLAMGKISGAYSLKNEITVEWVAQLLRWGEQLGFTLDGYRSFDAPLDPAKIEKCREIVLARVA